jgi:ADP-dependent NAD(P)H-hydrate dehydratase / NAD(P)H-hydrate epimerase
MTLTHDLLTTSEMAEADRLSIACGIPGIALMESAGRAVAEAAGAMMKPGAKVAVLCGPGNNGGDGFVAARVLAGRGFDVSLALLGSRETLKGDALLAAQGWDGPILAPESVDLAAQDLIIDALFGAGLSRPVTGEAETLVRAINRSGRPVLAVDVPSGLDGNTGQAEGAVVAAQKTVTFFRMKPGHVLYPGRRLCGETVVADIGIPATVLATIKPQTCTNDASLWKHALRVPSEEGHKFDRGHLLVLSGGIESTGAARLAAHAGARAGAGLVTVASPSDALAVNAAALSDIMVRSSDGATGLEHLLEDKRRNAVVLGPGAGAGEPLKSCVRLVLDKGRALVLDADALTSFSSNAAGLKALIGENHASSCVATPHDGEFSRLFAAESHILSASGRLERARRAAAFLGLVVVLKGPDCVIAAPDGRALINTNGSPWLATAGSGDVLAGAIGGFLAQSLPAFEAAAAAVWLHAEAGRALGAGLLARDLPVAMREALGRLLATA